MSINFSRVCKYDFTFNEEAKEPKNVPDIIDLSAEKDLGNLPRDVLKRVVRTIDKLAEDPKPHGIKKLHGSNESLFRIRVGDYRIIYAITEKIKIVNIRRVRHRKDVYRNL